MTSNEIARDKAARLLKKRGSMSSVSSSEVTNTRPKRQGSMSTISFMDDPGHDIHTKPVVQMENTYQLTPIKRFPQSLVKTIIKDVLDSYLAAETYDPELCKQISKTLSEVVKARVKDLDLPRYKLICIVHIGQLKDQGLRMGSRCLWDSSSDSFSNYEFRNQSLFAVGTVYAIYAE